MDWLLPALITMILYSLWGLFPKLATLYLDLKSAFFWQAIGALIVVLSAIPFLRFQIEFNWKGALFGGLAGIFGVLGGYTYLLAVTKGKLSAVVMIIALYPIVTAMLAFLLLGETLTTKQTVGAVLAVVALGIFSLP